MVDDDASASDDDCGRQHIEIKRKDGSNIGGTVRQRDCRKVELPDGSVIAVPLSEIERIELS